MKDCLVLVTSIGLPVDCSGQYYSDTLKRPTDYGSVPDNVRTDPYTNVHPLDGRPELFRHSPLTTHQ